MSIGSSDPAVVGGAHPDAVTGVDWHLPRRTAAANVLVAIPAYNEERFIGSVVLRAGLLGFDVLVVDDGSVDRTTQIAQSAGAIVEVHAENRGKAAALNTAFRLARERGVSILVVMDGDAQHAADEIERFLTPVREGLADIVVGSRFLAASGGQIPRMRRLGQRAMTTMTNVASGISVSDSQSGFRAFSARAIEALVFGSSGFSVEVEMQFQARDHGLTVAEVPISANYEDPPKRNIVGHGMQVLDGILRLVGQKRPLFFFGYPGVLSMVLGLLLGLRVADIQRSTGDLAVGYALLTVLFVVMGLLGLFTAVILHSVRLAFLNVERRIITAFDRGTPE
jgi:glycosyltransferase involved in cell wall biosynthesis